MEKNIVLIGAGNMGGALLRGVLAGSLNPAAKTAVVDPQPQLRAAIEKELGVRTAATADRFVGDADILIVAVKPFVLADVLDGIKDLVRPTQLIVSVVAGVQSQTIQSRLGQPIPLVRVMPNIAATVGASASAVAACPPTTTEQVDMARALFSAVGEVVEVSEEQLDAVTGLSGSGPAYVYSVIEALADGGVRMGLARDVALRLAAQTVLGAARLVLESGEHPAVLRDRVTTPAGTTIHGLHALERGGLRAALIDAVAAATERSIALREV